MLPQLHTSPETTEQSEEKPPVCFGIFWEPVGDSWCKQCPFQEKCLDRFVGKSIARARAVLGAVPLETLASKLDVKPEAVLLAMEYMISGTYPVNNEEAMPPKKKAVLPPPQAEPAKTAKVSASKTPKQGKPAKDVTGQAESNEWSKETHKQRFQRERKRSRLIKALKPGQTLTREYKGTTHKVAVLQDGYLYNNQKYPTLYKVTEAATGTQEYNKQKRPDGTTPRGKRPLCNWSASKFWKLHRPAKKR